MNFKLSVIDTDRHIYDGEAKSVTIPAAAGQMTVLATHMPIVTPVSLGEVILETPTETINLVVGKGIFSMEGNVATLLIEDAMYTKEISEERALEAKEKAEELVKKGVVGADMEAAMQRLRRSVLDLKVSKKYRIPRN